jgi:hypothetical protein
MSTIVSLATAPTVPRELPLPPWAFAAMALLFFAFLLGVTWSFRGTSQKYARPDLQGDRQDSTATGPNDRASRTVAEADSPHWPEHPASH